jgi:hypothetical protein
MGDHHDGVTGRSECFALTGDIPLRFHITMEVRLDEAKPLFDTAFDVSSSFTDIAEDLLALRISPEQRIIYVVLTASR